MGYQVIAVSTDSPQQAGAHRKKNDFPVLLAMAKAALKK